MKSLLLPLVACAALAGCADYGTAAYGTAAYGNYGAYPAYPTYPGYSAYPASPYDGYAYGWPGGFYGAPALGVTIQGERFRDGHRGDWRGGDRDWHGGHGHMAGAPRRDPDTNALGAGPGRTDRDHGGRWAGRHNDSGGRTAHGDGTPRERPQ